MRFVVPEIFERIQQISKEVLFEKFNVSGLVVFRGQKLTLSELEEIASMFGNCLRYPKGAHFIVERQYNSIVRISGERNEHGDATGIFGTGEVDWHNDASILNGDYFGAMLYAVSSPELASTYWASTELAYEDLPQDWRMRLRDAVGEYSCEKYDLDLSKSESRFLRSGGRHNLLREHPVTGKYSVYASPGAQMNEFDFDFAQLRDFLTQEKYVYEHKWAQGDLVLFDNLRTMHKRGRVSGSGRELWRAQFDLTKMTS